MTIPFRTAAALALLIGATTASADPVFTSEVALPEDVLLRVADLWDEADRYEAAITAIVSAAQVPDWNEGCACETPDAAPAERAPGM